ncbi:MULTISPECIES: DbpA RNA binding domain-containing protein [Myxococcus]|uniref:DbpA RNA binding domain-containing protein n=1 Tax=Myxococcus TaxID=32 RepID=UPI001E606540|nr:MULTISPECIES: DbpA RNA binding domain-containing protein [Myxococcus]UYI14184.1 DbpA RNA binding domain-containing protein [Myxococcus xanthus]UYI21551.1 DbpA RNA binding domain-containing protein [Myxococcus xanthus]
MGKIEFHDHHAFVAVSKRVAKMALQRLREECIKGRKTPHRARAVVASPSRFSKCEIIQVVSIA